MSDAAHQILSRLGRGLGVRRLAGIAGYDLVRRHYYSPIPQAEQLPDDIWRVKSELRGVGFNVAFGLRFLQDELSPHLAEYHPPRDPTADPRQFYLDNGFYEGLDAETLYAMVRRLRPRRIIELGSGFSTLVIADARARNGVRSTHEVYDPFPNPNLLPALEKIASVVRTSAKDIPLRAFAELQQGDLLFVDTTHTVKLGSEVNRIVLDVLPSLASGVHVHFHDIFLPWEYPKEFVTERRFFWSEQYLLQAFLAFNTEFEVLFGTHALKRMYPDAILAAVPAAANSRWPSAFWLRRA